MSRTRAWASMRAGAVPADREALGRAIRRMGLGALLDERADFTKLRSQIRLLIAGYLARSAGQETIQLAESA